MTSFSQVSFFNTNKKASTQITTMNVIALMVFVLLFLLSTLAHADHLAEQTTNVEQSECYICHQGLDTPPELPQVQLLSITHYFFTPKPIVTTGLKASYFVKPQLRAPPVFQ
jgi:hypothetical protein